VAAANNSTQMTQIEKTIAADKPFLFICGIAVQNLRHLR
jgi:hypothetical protein